MQADDPVVPTLGVLLRVGRVPFKRVILSESAVIIY
jgi:hypothetical protein